MIHIELFLQFCYGAKLRSFLQDGGHLSIFHCLIPHTISDSFITAVRSGADTSTRGAYIALNNIYQRLYKPAPVHAPY